MELSMYQTGSVHAITRKPLTVREIEEAWVEFTQLPFPDPRVAAELLIADELRRHHAWTLRRQRMLEVGAFKEKWVP